MIIVKLLVKAEPVYQNALQRPSMFGLRKAAEPDDDNSSTVRNIKATLNKHLNRWFSLRNLKLNSPLVLAAALDP